MKTTKCYITAGSKDFEITKGLVNSFEMFGREVLKTDFDFIFSPTPIPVGDYQVKLDENTISVDAYNWIMYRFFEIANKQGKPLFIGATTDCNLYSLGLETDREAFASSVQRIDLEKAKKGEYKLISPDYASAIISSKFFGEKESDIEREIKSTLLGIHELGHLVHGIDVCSDESCVYSHPIDSLGALNKMVKHVQKNRTIPVCDMDKQRIKYFQQKWGIK